MMGTADSKEPLHRHGYYEVDTAHHWYPDNMTWHMTHDMTWHDMTWHDMTWLYSPVERVVEQDVDVRMDQSIVNFREVSLDHIHDGEDDVEAALGSRG